MRKLSILFITLILLSAIPVVRAQNANSGTDSVSETIILAERKLKQDDFQGAIDIVKEHLSYRSLTSEQKERLNAYLTRIQKSRDDAYVFRVDKNTLSVPFDSAQDSVEFMVGRLLKVESATSSASWCKVGKVAENKIYLSISANGTKKPREAKITVYGQDVKKKRGTKKLTVIVTQDLRPDTFKHLYVQTEPKWASIQVGTSPETFSAEWLGRVPSGACRIRVKKNQYQSVDTLVTVPDDFNADTLIVPIKLVPAFAKLQIQVEPEEGFSFFEGKPTLTVGGKVVNLDDKSRSYDTAEDVRFGYLYSDNTIPVAVREKAYLEASAQHFDSKSWEGWVKVGEVVPVSLVLKARTGALTLTDEGNASDALVRLGSIELGPVSGVQNKLVLEGTYPLILEKDGYMAREDYVISVQKDRQSFQPVKMDRYRDVQFFSNPSGAAVTVDGDTLGVTPSLAIPLIEREYGSPFDVRIRLQGYKEERLCMYIDSMKNGDSVSVSLEKTYPFFLAADQDGLLVKLSRKRKGKTLIDVEDHVRVNSQIEIPLQEEPYYLELIRPGLKEGNAYRGWLSFNNPEKNSHKYYSFHETYAQAIAGELFLVGSGPYLLGRKEYRHWGNVYLGRLGLSTWGLSTSLLRGSFFLGTDKEQICNVNDISFETAHFLPAISCAFINADFRMGVAVWEFIDANALLSYAWYPDLFRTIAGFSHVTGHDIFVGAEVSSRIPYFNVTLKAGLQLYRGLKANLYSKEIGGSSTRVENQYVMVPLDGVVPENQFVLSLCFALGGKNVKGNNILRLWP